MRPADEGELNDASQRIARENADALALINRFAAKMGRPLRVLHIGNIANNAYNNACIQRKFGIEADVLCYNYYHIMGCPEWEDAAIREGASAIEQDHFRPDWWATSLRGWKRPAWFAQGPSVLCSEYLHHRNAGRRLATYLKWLELELAALEDARSAGSKPPITKFIPARLQFLLWLRTAERTLQSALLKEGSLTPYKIWLGTSVANGIIGRSDGAEPTWFDRMSAVTWLKMRRGRHVGAQDQVQHAKRLTVYRIWLGLAVANGVLGRSEGSEPSWLDRMSVAAWLRLRGRREVDMQDRVALAAHRDGVRNLRSRWLRRQLPLSVRERQVDLQDRAGLALHRSNVRKLQARWSVWAPWLVRALIARTLVVERMLVRLLAPAQPGCIEQSRPDPATRAKEIDSLLEEIRNDPVELDGDSLSYRDEYITHHPRTFESILSHYDVIQGYSIDGLIPLVNGVRNFCCYEHGTLREIPFESNLTGLICRFTFQRAPAVFVTNSDVLPSVERLKLKPERVFYLPHAFDDRKLRDFRAAHPELAPPKSGPVIFFSPTRHHWRNGNTSWLKGNDVVIRAAAELAREQRDFRLVFVEWGQEVAESKALIEQLGLSGMVEWVPTMSKRELWRRYCASHAVVDQFIVPALGGVGFETMALGVRLISAIDVAQTALFFGQSPPCLTARSVAECAVRLREVLDDPLDSKGRGPAASHWMTTYHSAERIVALQCTAYRKLLSGQW
ncbi:glycosyltransferase [Bradyrhizobium sp. CCBAU 51627]|uniref:glycosyltransferase n=1 Tax=Bradyrhizobium sp. CCBAU 51627 TaxID=1325088 RepID=UPI002304EF09|nr:glycosyltransferase [Bradyrhizobium sp. CCBAU 51627]